MKIADARQASNARKTRSDLERVKRAGDYVWDGSNEDDRPASATELAAARKVGRPRATVVRPMVSIRLDPDVLAGLRASGPGWQTRVNILLREAVTKGKL